MTDGSLSAIASQHRAIQEEYRRQAPRWGRLEITDHLRWVVEHLPVKATSQVVDVAAGSGLFGRSVAPLVAQVTAVDLTPEMIEQGRRRSAADGIDNIDWKLGAAEQLPLPDECCDVAMTRYSIHHFVDPVTVLREMARICRPDGVVVVVDMVSDEDHVVADRHDALETAMDRTHTHILSRSRLVQAGADAGLTLLEYLSRDVPMHFDRWQEHIPADAPGRQLVREALETELAGGPGTGMRPYRSDGELWFMHVWGVLIAGKRHRGFHGTRPA